MTSQRIHDLVANRPGIIFFKDCFRRRKGSAGDHIDYWDGAHVMNDLLHYNAPNERSPDEAANWLHFFQKAECEIWFLPIVNG